MISFETDDGTELDADLAAFREALAKPQPASEAPFGYTTDPRTGEERPKRAKGRPRKSPSIAELREARDDSDAIQDVSPADTPPAKNRKGKIKVVEPPPPYKAGVIAHGMNKLYRRVGKIMNGFDPIIGAGIIDAATEEEDKVTVGEAWDELAKTNPRIRRFLMKMLTGKGYVQLVWAHLPMFLAMYMSVQMRMNGTHPNQTDPKSMGDKFRTAASQVIPELPGGNPLAGLKEEDMSQMMAMAQSMMPAFMSQMQQGASP